MNTGQASTANTRAAIKIISGVVPFWRNWFATKDLLIEVCERPPIAGDEIRVHVFRRDAQARRHLNRPVSSSVE